MTIEHEREPSAGVSAPSSSMPLPFDPLDMVRVRVRPATFARLAGVSRQAVCDWQRKGWIAISGDGLIDPVAGLRQVIERSEPKRLRVRLLKEATAHFAQMRQRIADLESQLRSVEEVTRCDMALGYLDQLGELRQAILDRFEHLAEAHAAGRLASELDRVLLGGGR